MEIVEISLATKAMHSALSGKKNIEGFIDSDMVLGLAVSSGGEKKNAPDRRNIKRMVSNFNFSDDESIIEEEPVKIS